MKGLVIFILAYFHLFGLAAPNQAKLEKTALGPGYHQIQLSSHSALPTPVKTGTDTLGLDATSALAWDVDSATPIYSFNPNKQVPIASITKLFMTLVILKDHGLEETVTVPTLPAFLPEDAKLGLVAGQTFRLADLLAAALIPSANDAAEALALYDSGTTSAFSAKMNRLATEWGITGVHFTNPSGLSDQDNYATAQALAQVGKLALTNPTVATLVSTSSSTISDSAGHSYNLSSTDPLLSNQVRGIKTGYTLAAGQCFVGLAGINGHRVITVILGSGDRFGQTTKLINYLESNFVWQ